MNCTKCNDTGWVSYPASGDRHVNWSPFYWRRPCDCAGVIKSNYLLVTAAGVYVDGVAGPETNQWARRVQKGYWDE